MRAYEHYLETTVKHIYTYAFYFGVWVFCFGYVLKFT